MKNYLSFVVSDFNYDGYIYPFIMSLYRVRWKSIEPQVPTVAR